MKAAFCLFVMFWLLACSSTQKITSAEVVDAMNEDRAAINSLSEVVAIVLKRLDAVERQVGLTAETGGNGIQTAKVEP